MVYVSSELMLIQVSKAGLNFHSSGFKVLQHCDDNSCRNSENAVCDIDTSNSKAS